MTMRTFRYFVCPNQHRGEEKTSENDQPFSGKWDVDVTGMRGTGRTASATKCTSASPVVSP